MSRHRAELTALERAAAIAEWTRLTQERPAKKVPASSGKAPISAKGGKASRVSAQVVQKLTEGRSPGGLSASARDLGISRQDAQRAALRASIDGSRSEPSNPRRTLADLGITKKQSSQWQKLDALQRVLSRLRLSDDADDGIVAEAIADFLAGASLDMALGLVPGWRDGLRGQARDRALAQLAEQFPGTCRSRAANIASAVGRYHDAAWPRDRLAGRRPTGLRGLAYDFLLVGEPIGADRIRRVLRDSGADETLAPPHCAPESQGREEP